MTLRQLLFIIAGATLVCWGMWGTVLVEIDPTSTDWLGFGLFYLALFFALLGSFFLLIFFIRRLLNKFMLEYKIVGLSFRQAFLFSVLSIALLLLSSHDLLTWWNIILLIGGLTLIEFFVISARRSSL